MDATQGPKAHAVGINHVAIEVGDIGQALEFYGRFLAFRVDERTRDMAIIYFGDQFTKADHVLRSMGLGHLKKADEALAELRAKGMAPG